jgi:hypothetical protein
MDGVKVARRRAVARDEPGRHLLTFRRDLCLVRKLEIDASHPCREVVNGSRRVPRVGREALVSGTQFVVLVRQQQAALDQVGNLGVVLDLDPPSLRNREERSQAVLVERSGLAGQGGGDERWIPFAVGEEVCGSPDPRQRLVCGSDELSHVDRLIRPRFGLRLWFRGLRLGRRLRLRLLVQEA